MINGVMSSSMESFYYRVRQLYCNEISVALMAENYGTLLCVYSQHVILGTSNDLKVAFFEFDPLI